MIRVVLSLLVVGSASCLKTWDAPGPWKCSEGEVCPNEYTCDDGVCCIPGGTPSCPTLPLPGGGCVEGEPKVLYRDADGDGDGNPKVSRVFCRAPVAGGWVDEDGDCDDTDPAINSHALEQCNGKDDNCNQKLDEGLPIQQTFYADEDGDGFGEASTAVTACVAPTGYVDVAGDCDAFDPSRFPGAGERCNGLDDNCNNVSDENETHFVDTDDGETSNFPCTVSNTSGICLSGTFRCRSPVRVCESIQSATLEVCNGLDDDCDGMVDEQPACGGPTSVFTQSGAVIRAQKLPSTSSNAELFGSCQADRAGTSIAVSNGIWSGTGAGYYVFSAEAPSGTTWDLSNLNAQLKLAFSTSAVVGGTTPNFAWGSPADGAARNPVIYLCGDSADQYIRYVALDAAPNFKTTDTSANYTFPINNNAPGFIVGNGSGFGTNRVKRVEVLFQFFGTSFTMNMSTVGFAK